MNTECDRSTRQNTDHSSSSNSELQPSSSGSKNNWIKSNQPQASNETESVFVHGERDCGRVVERLGICFSIINDNN